MANVITIKRTASISELLSAQIMLTVLLFTAIVKTAYMAYLGVKSWLNTEHDYSNEEGTIHMTGWQTVGFGIVVSIVAIVLSIQF